MASVGRLLSIVWANRLFVWSVIIVLDVLVREKNQGLMVVALQQIFFATLERHIL